MRKGIVLKLFTLTAALCMLILATIFIGQTIFFKQYYANKKVQDVQADIRFFEKEYLNSGGDIERIQKLEQEFHSENNNWITTLDRYGNLKHVNDFYLEVKVNQSAPAEWRETDIIIPLYNLISVEEFENEKSPYFVGMPISTYGINIDSTFIPADLNIVEGDGKWINKPLQRKILDMQIKFKEKKISKESPAVYLKGTVTKVQQMNEKGMNNSLYKNTLFLDSIKEFQANLLLNEDKAMSDTLQIMDYEKNDIKYKLFIKPITEQDGSLTYIFAMASLQPVDEAVRMVKDYYVYMIAFVLILIILVSFYYSKQIAKPLLRINDTTKKMAHLDFSEKIQVTSKDEIGDLSNNINMLSSSLHSHIEQLEQDIEKEKRLENTRKEFISGVSHELKTPLSIMKSCISILKDGVAEHKKEYYFKAMEKEVDKMDMLILDMLELAKFESGTYKMQMDVFYINEVIEDTCEQLSLEIEKKEIELCKYLYSLQVIGNQHRIGQVIVNFITNAIRYTPEKERIIVSTIEEQNRVKICIENKGAHIQENQLDKIWDRFYRIDTSRHRSNGGTGMGLAISKNILELHGAPHGVENTEDGVLFYFYLQKKEDN